MTSLFRKAGVKSFLARGWGCWGVAAGRLGDCSSADPGHGTGNGADADSEMPAQQSLYRFSSAEGQEGNTVLPVPFLRCRAQEASSALPVPVFPVPRAGRGAPGRLCACSGGRTWRRRVGGRSGRPARPGAPHGRALRDVCERERPGARGPAPLGRAMSVCGGPGDAAAARLRPRAALMARRPELLCGAAIVLGCAFLVALKVTCRYRRGSGRTRGSARGERPPARRRSQRRCCSGACGRAAGGARRAGVAPGAVYPLRPGRVGHGHPRAGGRILLPSLTTSGPRGNCRRSYVGGTPCPP